MMLKSVVARTPAVVAPTTTRTTLTRSAISSSCVRCYATAEEKMDRPRPAHFGRDWKPIAPGLASELPDPVRDWTRDFDRRARERGDDRAFRRTAYDKGVYASEQGVWQLVYDDSMKDKLWADHESSVLRKMRTDYDPETPTVETAAAAPKVRREPKTVILTEEPQRSFFFDVVPTLVDDVRSNVGFAYNWVTQFLKPATRELTDKTESGIERAKESVEALKEKGEQGIEALKEKGGKAWAKEEAGKLKETGEKLAKEGAEKVKEGAEKLKQEASKAGEWVSEKAKEATRSTEDALKKGAEKAKSETNKIADEIQGHWAKGNPSTQTGGPGKDSPNDNK